MVYILSIETSTRACSVALHADHQLIAANQYLREKSHSTILTALVNETVLHAGIHMEDLGAVAISEGPGSYTGLRIGTSTAKGLCYGLDIPLIAINTLESMAGGANKHNHTQAHLCPMLDARRMEVYCLVQTPELTTVRGVEPLVMTEDAMEALIANRDTIFCGDGSAKCKPLTTSKHAIFLDDFHPSATDIGDLAWLKYQKEEFEDLAYFEPFYLKAFRVGKPKQLI